MEVSDRLLGVVLHHVGNHDVAHVLAVDRDVQDRSREVAVVPGGPVLGHELVVAHEHQVLVHECADAVAGLLPRLGNPPAVDLSGVGGAHGDGDGVVREGLGVRRHG